MSENAPNYGRKQFYTVYLSKTDEIVASGTAAECASALKRTLASFYCLVTRVRNGNLKKYEIAQEDYDEN